MKVDAYAVHWMARETAGARCGVSVWTSRGSLMSSDAQRTRRLAHIFRNKFVDGPRNEFALGQRYR